MTTYIYSAIDPSIPFKKISLNSGASDAKLDLREMDIEHLDIQAGASNIEIGLGNKTAKSQINIHSGASDIAIHVPKDVGIKFQNESFVNSLHTDDLLSMGRGQYQSENYVTAKKTVDIYLKGGASILNIDRSE